MSDEKPRRARGDRAWTDEQRRKQSEYMKKLHAQKKKEAELTDLPEKTGGIEKMTLGTLLRALQSYAEIGANEDTPVIFQKTCLQNQEITGKHSFDPNIGRPVVDCIIIR